YPTQLSATLEFAREVPGPSEQDRGCPGPYSQTAVRMPKMTPAQLPQKTTRQRARKRRFAVSSLPPKCFDLLRTDFQSRFVEFTPAWAAETDSSLVPCSLA